LADFIRLQGGWLKYPIYALVEKAALARCDRIIVATPAQARLMAGRYGQERIVWVPNFVDTDLFSPDDRPRRDYLLFVGRFNSQKNLPALLEAVALRQTQRPIVLVGQGEEEDTLRRLASHLGLQVRFAGVVPNDSLPELYRRAWAFVLPSRYEGMPKALLEAMACATPCLGSDVDGIRDLIVDEENGLLVPPTTQSLAIGLARLEDDELRQTIGQGARRFVVDNFSMAEVMAREIGYLQGITS
jgi:glycosyltransferase involved in cell wall biosynthesis